MARLIDLRSYNIKSDEDVVEFLDLFETKIPQIKEYMKKQRLARVSLENRLSFAKSEAFRLNPVQQMEVINRDASVVDRLAGNTRPVLSDEQNRIAQMKSAQTIEASLVAEDVLAPAAPGEIGQLHVADIEGHAPLISEEEVVAAAGSKSERAVDDDVQPEGGQVYAQFHLNDDIYQHVIGEGDKVNYLKNSKSISEGEFEFAQATANGAVFAPSEADLKPIGDLIAEKTDNGTKKA